MDEAVLLHQWLKSYLTTDSVLHGLLTSITRDYARQGTALPYGIWTEQGGQDQSAPCGTALAEVVMLVKVVYDDRADDTNAIAAVNRLYEMLNGHSAVYQGYRIHVVSLGPVGYPEPPTTTGGIYYRHQGRLWRLTASNN